MLLKGAASAAATTGSRLHHHYCSKGVVLRHALLAQSDRYHTPEGWQVLQQLPGSCLPVWQHHLLCGRTSALLVTCKAGKSSGSSSTSTSSSSTTSSSNRSYSSSNSSRGKPSAGSKKQQAAGQPSPPRAPAPSGHRRDSSSSSSSSSSSNSSNSSSKRSSAAAYQSSSKKAARISSSGSSSSSNNSSSPGFAGRNSRLPASAQLLVVGAGAAGLTAAYFAAKAGAKVTVVERTREAGKKILMSGGTRCNVLPLEVELPLDYFTSSSSGALRAIFAGWTLAQCKDWLSKDIGLDLMLEQETNKWFPASNSSREVRDRLVVACEEAGVSFTYNASVEHITPPPAAAAAADAAAGATTDSVSSGGSNSSSSSSSSLWQVGLASGASLSATQIIFSTGGRSFPAVGTDGTGLNLLSSLGHRLVPQYAALTPLKGHHPGRQQLAGLTLSDVRLSATKPGSSSSSSSSSKVAAVAQRGGLLFTHKGYSGPAVLDLSHWLVRTLDQQQQQQAAAAAAAAVPRLLVNWLGEDVEVWQQRLAAAGGATTVESLMRKAGIKERLAAALAAEVGISGKQLSQLKKAEREQLLTALTAWQLPVTGHEGYGKAEVTGGGVALEEIDCKTMQSRVLPGLFLCGEVLDVFGRIGGFNFYWAWLTGKVAGQAAAAAALQQQQQEQQTARATRP